MKKPAFIGTLIIISAIAAFAKKTNDEAAILKFIADAEDYRA
jgi:hypothetical protein